MKGLEIVKKIKRRPYQPMTQFDIDTIEKELKALKFLIDYGKIRIVDNMLYFGGCYFDLRKGEDISLLKEVMKNE